MKPWWTDLELLKAVITAGGSIVAALIIAVAGTLLSRFFARARDRQDKEAQWRDHAIELAKLDLQRHLEGIPAEKRRKQIRPSILDFLANYRDLTELDSKTPRDLFETIMQKRVSRQRPGNAGSSG